MAKKNYKFFYDAPITLTLVMASIFIFILDTTVLKGKLSALLLTCGTGAPETKFNPSDALDYIRIFTHILGNSGWNMLLVNASILLLCGPTLEERYGSFFVGIMVLLSTVVSGVLRQTLCPYPTTGASCLVFMMIILSSVMAFSKKEIKLSYILIFLTFATYSLMEGKIESENFNGFKGFFQGNVHTFIDLAAGLCGSLLGFLVAPKKKKENTKKTSSDTTWTNSKKDQNPEEETLIGSMEF